MPDELKGWKITIIVLCIIIFIYAFDTFIFIFNNESEWECEKNETFIQQTFFIGKYGNCIPKYPTDYYTEKICINQTNDVCMEWYLKYHKRE